MNRAKRPDRAKSTTHRSYTLQVLEAIGHDIVQSADIAQTTGLEPNRIGAALSHLVRHHMVERTLIDGRIWYAATAQDQRAYTKLEIADEEPGSRRPRTGPGPETKSKPKHKPATLHRVPRLIQAQIDAREANAAAERIRAARASQVAH